MCLGHKCVKEGGRASWGEEGLLLSVLLPMRLRFLYKEGQHDTAQGRACLC